eukprot:403342098
MFDLPQLIDKGSVNGCTINGKKLEKGGTQPLRNGDSIKFGKYALDYKFIGPPSEVDISRDSMNDQKIRLVTDQPHSYAIFDHISGQPIYGKDPLRSSKNPFEQNYVPHYANSLEEFESPSPQKQSFQNTLNFPNPTTLQFQNPSTQIRPNFTVPGTQTIEDRLRNSEANMQSLIDKERRLMEDKVAQSMIREQRYNLDKEMTVKQIVDEEKKFIQDRFKTDIDRLQATSMKQVQTLEQQTINVKNKNEKLQRVLVEKEATLLELQSQNAKLINELKNTHQNKDLSEAKLRALEQYTTDLQVKYDQLQNADNDKAQALGELLQNDLPARLVEYKKQIQELRSSSDYYSKSLLEKQSSEMLNFQKTIEEYERRQQVCEKKWAELLKENQLNFEQTQIYKDQLEKQRESYNRLLTMTERRVIQANNAIALAYSETGDEEKKQAAEFLSGQIYQLYEERRQLLMDKDQLQLQNNELQRLNVSLRVDLEKYRAYIAEDFSGHNAQLISRVEELQDLLIQQRQMTDVSIIVDAHAQLRSLNVELAKKTKIIDDLKSKVQNFNSKKNAKDLKQDEDVVEYLVGIVKDKDKTIEELQFRITQIVKREADLKDKVERYEFIYDDGQIQNSNQAAYFQKRQGVLEELNKFNNMESQVAQVQRKIHNGTPQDLNMREQKDKSEWLFF